MSDQDQVVERRRVRDDQVHRARNSRMRLESCSYSSTVRLRSQPWSFRNFSVWLNSIPKKFTDLASGKITAAITFERENLERAPLTLHTVKVQLVDNRFGHFH